MEPAEILFQTTVIENICDHLSLEDMFQLKNLFKACTFDRVFEISDETGKMHHFESLTPTNINSYRDIQRRLGRRLMGSAKRGQIATVRLLLAEPGTPVNYQEGGNHTALRWAFINKNIRIFALLLTRSDINVNLQNMFGLTILNEICHLTSLTPNRKRMTELLLNHPKIDVNLQDYKGRTPLMGAARWGHLDLLRLLLARPEIQINLQDNFGHSALIESVSGYSMVTVTSDTRSEVVRLLLAHPNIRADLKDSQGKTALVWALENKHMAPAALIRDYSQTHPQNLPLPVHIPVIYPRRVRPMPFSFKLEP